MLASFAGSFITIAFGIGGGGLVLAVMASLLPPAALIPVHGVVQFGSNAGRSVLMARHLHVPALGWFLVGAVLGTLGAARIAVTLPAAWVQIGVGGFLVWTVLARAPDWMRNWPFVTGLITAGVSMVFGASGPFVTTYLKALNLGRHAHVATLATLQTLLHLMKVLAFGALGFAYAPWAGFLLAMVGCGLIGTWVGGKVLNRISDARFRQVLNALLLVLAVQLVWSGLRGLLAGDAP